MICFLAQIDIPGHRAPDPALDFIPGTSGWQGKALGSDALNCGQFVTMLHHWQAELSWCAWSNAQVRRSSTPNKFGVHLETELLLLLMAGHFSWYYFHSSLQLSAVIKTAGTKEKYVHTRAEGHTISCVLRHRLDR